MADEPTGALDTKAARLLMEKLQEVNQVQGRTILMVTHDPNGTVSFFGKAGVQRKRSDGG